MGCRQTLPWDYFPLARDPLAIGGKLQMELHPGIIAGQAANVER
jgi:hypothetical protein